MDNEKGIEAKKADEPRTTSSNAATAAGKDSGALPKLPNGKYKKPKKSKKDLKKEPWSALQPSTSTTPQIVS